MSQSAEPNKTAYPRTAILRRVLLDGKEEDKLESVFDDIIEGRYSQVFEKLVNVDVKRYISIVCALVVARPGEFEYIFHNVKGTAAYAIRPNPNYRYGALIGVIAGATFILSLSADEVPEWDTFDKEFIDFVLWVLRSETERESSPPAELETKLSDAIAHLVGNFPPEINPAWRLLTGLVKRLSEELKESELIDVKSFPGSVARNLTHKLWARVSPGQQLRILRSSVMSVPKS